MPPLALCCYMKRIRFLQNFHQFAGVGGEGLKTYTNNAVSLSGDGDLFVIEGNKASESGD